MIVTTFEIIAVHELTFTIALSTHEDGSVTAECIEFPGCIVEGKSIAEARKNIREEISLGLAARAGKAAA